MIETIRQGLKQDGFDVSISKLCRWFEIPRRTAYYKPTKAPAKVQERFVQPIKEMIESNPSFGYRTVAHLLDFNKNTVQRIFQLKGWQVRKRPVGMRPRVQELPSVAERPNERWATDMCRIWSGRDGWTVFTSRGFTALVKGYGLRQEFITPHNPQQNGMVERVIRTLKEQCVHRHRFESLQHASRAIGDWIGFYNQRRPHQALGMKTPVEAFKLAA